MKIRCPPIGDPTIKDLPKKQHRKASTSPVKNALTLPPPRNPNHTLSTLPFKSNQFSPPLKLFLSKLRSRALVLRQYKPRPPNGNLCPQCLSAPKTNKHFMEECPCAI